MKLTLTQSMFINQFKSWDTYKDNFTYNALSALYDYYTELEEETGEEIDCDVVAICCDWNEYSSLDDYNKEFSENEQYDDIEQLQDDHQVIEFDGGILVSVC